MTSWNSLTHDQKRAHHASIQAALASFKEAEALRARADSQFSTSSNAERLARIAVEAEAWDRYISLVYQYRTLP